MTKFEVLRGIYKVKQFSDIIFHMAKEAGSPEKLAEALSKELVDAELRVVKSAAQSKDYPLSLDGMQKEDMLERLAEPLIHYLRSNCHPHTFVVITDNRMAVAETVLSIPNVGID